MWECCIVPAVSKMVFTPPPSCVSSKGGWGGVGVLIEYPSVSRFERGRGCGGVVSFLLSKMVFDVTRRVSPLLVTSLCLQRLGISQ